MASWWRRNGGVIEGKGGPEAADFWGRWRMLWGLSFSIDGGGGGRAGF